MARMPVLVSQEEQDALSELRAAIRAEKEHGLDGDTYEEALANTRRLHAAVVAADKKVSDIRKARRAAAKGGK